MVENQTGLSRLIIRTIMKFFGAKKCKPCEIYRRMCDVYGKACFSFKKSFLTNGLNMVWFGFFV